MTIAVKCQCGHRYKVDEKASGKKVRCPECQALSVAPAAAQRDAAEPAPAAGGAGAPQASGKLEYFLAGYDRLFRTPKLFRAYLDSDQLLFIFAGPFHASMIAQYQQEYATAVKKGAVAGLSAGAAGAAVGAGAVAAGLAIDWLAGKFQQGTVAARARELDAMTPAQLREEVDQNKKSFRGNAENIERAVIDKPNTSYFTLDQYQDVLPAYLRLKHRPTGMWHLQLMTDADVMLAVRGLRQLLGKDLKVKIKRFR